MCSSTLISIQRTGIKIVQKKLLNSTYLLENFLGVFIRATILIVELL